MKTVKDPLMYYEGKLIIYNAWTYEEWIELKEAISKQAIADHEEKQHYYACCGEPKGRRHKGWCENSKPYQEGGEG